MKEYEITLADNVEVIFEADYIEVREGHLWLFDGRLFPLADFPPGEWQMISNLAELDDP